MNASESTVYAGAVEETEESWESGEPTSAVDRFLMRSTLRIAWVDATGFRGHVTARGLDLSEDGIGFVSVGPIPASAEVFIELPNCKMIASGRVRWRQQCESGWQIGVALNGPFQRIC